MSATANLVFAGPPIDFEGIISRYSPVLFRVALQRLHNVEDAEDAVQDALLSAYKHIGQFEGRSQLSTWLTRIVTNAAGMKLRRYPRHETVSLDQNQESEGTSLGNELVDTRPNPETACAQTEMDETLHKALAQLSPKLRDAIQMRDLDGCSTRETANALRISTNALKSRVTRGRTNLSLLLSEVNRMRPAAEVGPVVNRTCVVGSGRRSLGHREASAEAESPAFLRDVK